MAEKYRPYLEAAQLEFIISTLQECKPNDVMADSILRNLQPFLLRIKMGLTKAHHAARTSVEESLGFTSAPQVGNKKLAAHQKFQMYPALCSPEEKDLALSYAWENNLMTTEESAAYEAQLFNTNIAIKGL